jgi:hypothetical protein
MRRKVRVTAPAARSWWRKKRWWAAVALWLIVAYPLSVGPANYAAARGWVPEGWVVTAYAPVQSAAQQPWLMEPYVRYVMRWRIAAYEHEGYIVDDPNGYAL